MNRKIFSLIGIGALSGVTACLLARLVHPKKKSAFDSAFHDDEILGELSSYLKEDDAFEDIDIDNDTVRTGYILKTDLRDALRLLFSTYSDEEIAEYSACLDCTDGDLREYWVDVMTSLLPSVLNDNWRKSPRLEAYGSHSVDLVGKHGEIFDTPSCILVNDQVDCIYDRFCAVEHNIQLLLSDDGELAVVTMFGFMRGPMVLGYSDMDYLVDDDSVLPWSFRELMSRLYRFIDNGRAW